MIIPTITTIAALTLLPHTKTVIYFKKLPAQEQPVSEQITPVSVDTMNPK